MGEWNGAWSDGSKEWTPYWMQKLNHRFGDDGLFWMSYEDLNKRFELLDRTRLFDKEWTVVQEWTSVSVAWVTGYLNTKFVVEIKKKGPTVFVLCQVRLRQLETSRLLIATARRPLLQRPRRKIQLRPPLRPPRRRRPKRRAHSPRTRRLVRQPLHLCRSRPRARQIRSPSQNRSLAQPRRARRIRRRNEDCGQEPAEVEADWHELRHCECKGGCGVDA